MSDIDEIRDVICRYNAALSIADARAMAALKCPAEAKSFLGLYAEDQLDDIVVDAPEPVDPLMSDCVVDGDRATIKVRPPARPDHWMTVHLRRHGTEWRICEEPYHLDVWE